MPTKVIKINPNHYTDNIKAGVVIDLNFPNEDEELNIFGKELVVNNGEEFFL